jgi:septum formation topological specificity factor MinE
MLYLDYVEKVKTKVLKILNKYLSFDGVFLNWENI